MQFPQSFVPTAGQVGAVAMLTEGMLQVAVYAFSAAALFFVLTRTSVMPRRRPAAAIMASVAAVSAYSYLGLSETFHDMLHQLAATSDVPSKRRLIHDAYLAIGPYRSMNWAVTMPLLSLIIPLSLNARPREMLRPLAGLMGASFAAAALGFIGEQQIGPDGSVYTLRRVACGAAALLAFAAVPWILFRVMAPRFGGGRDHEDARAFRLMSWMTLTTWCIYPVVYMVPMLAPEANFNWLHLAATIGDLVNQLGLGAIGYIAGAAELERRVPPEAVQSGRMVG